MNDIKDIETDRLNSARCTRPLASGVISIKQAFCCFIVLLVCSIVINSFISTNSPANWTIFLMYFIINILYSFYLNLSVLWKREISNWFSLTIICGTFYLASGKRRNELVRNEVKKKEVLKFYTYNFLDKIMYMCITLALMFYSLWTLETMPTLKFNLVWTIPLLMLIIFKYSLAVEKSEQGDPTELILGDKVLISMILLYGVIMFFILYSNQFFSF